MVLGRKRVILRQCDNQWFTMGNEVDDFGIFYRGARECHIDGSVDDRSAQLSCVHGMKDKLHAWVRISVGIKYPRQDGEGCRPYEPDLQHPDRTLRSFFRDASCIGHASEDVSGPWQQRLACGGQVDVTSASVEKKGTDRSLQARDLPTEGGLSHPQSLGRPAEMEFLRHGKEVAQPTDVDALP
jgi:hypothetical protein